MSRASVVNFELFNFIFSNDGYNLKLVNFIKIFYNYQSLNLLIIGTITSLITLLILNKILLARENLFRMVCVINETIALYFTFTTNVYINYFIDNSESSKLTCKVLSFGIHMLTDASSWCLVAVGLTAYIKLRNLVNFPKFKFLFLIVIFIYLITIFINISYFTLTETIEISLRDKDKNDTKYFYVCGIQDHSVLLKMNFFDFLKNCLLPVALKMFIYFLIRTEENKLVRYGSRPSIHLFRTIFLIPVLLLVCKLPMYLFIFYTNFYLRNHEYEYELFKLKIFSVFPFLLYYLTHILFFFMFFHMRFRKKFVKLISYK